MAKMYIKDISSNGLCIEYNALDLDYFIQCYFKKNKNNILNFSISDFINIFLRDNNNYHVNNIKLKDYDDDNYNILINYKYIENKNGTHIFADASNELIVDREMFDNSQFRDIIYDEMHKLNKIKDLINKYNAVRYYEIHDLNNRILPEVLLIIDDCYNKNIQINFNNYNISQQEFIEYINNNKLYIAQFILQNCNKYNIIMKSSLISAYISFIGALSTVINNTDSQVLGKASIMILATTIIADLCAFIDANNKFKSITKKRSEVIGNLNKGRIK